MFGSFVVDSACKICYCYCSYSKEYVFDNEKIEMTSLFLLIFILRMDRLNTSKESPPLQPRLINAKHFTLIDFQNEQICYVVISTSGDGKCCILNYLHSVVTHKINM